MATLNKRVQVLFSEELWEKLVKTARERGVSVGEFIRLIVTQEYESGDMLERRRRAHEDILKIRKRFAGKLDYKALINEGRKR